MEEAQSTRAGRDGNPQCCPGHGRLGAALTPQVRHLSEQLHPVSRWSVKPQLTTGCMSGGHTHFVPLGARSDESSEEQEQEQRLGGGR